ncbi:MAG: winged helix-turn-helix domain-containing protein [Myxococcota bacterium]|nr:winged helix-turn-helix domain-containing protein [Myxococcota bacterium]
MEKPEPGNTQELFNFMVDKLGGENRVKSDFLRNKISNMDAKSKTVGDLINEAERDGWEQWLKGLNLGDFADMLSGHGGRRHSVIPRNGKRMTSKEKEELHKQILSYLKEHPWSQSSALALELGLPTRTIGLHLKALREQGIVATDGEKVKMRYKLL